MVSNKIIIRSLEIWVVHRSGCDYSRPKELATKNYFSPPLTINSVIERDKIKCTCAFEKGKKDSKKSCVYGNWEIPQSQRCECPLIFGLSLFFYTSICKSTSVPRVQHMSNTNNWSQHTNIQILTRSLSSKLTKHYQIFYLCITNTVFYAASRIRFCRTQPLIAKLMLLPSLLFVFFSFLEV